MVQVNATVVDKDQVGPFRRIRLEAPALASGLSAGRFVLADLGDYLRSPLFPAQLDPASFDVLVEPDHLAAFLQLGARCNLIGPLGRGYRVPDEAGHLLLVADVPHLPVLLPLTRRNAGSLDRPGISITLLLSAISAKDLYPIHLLPPSLEVQIATRDGTIGHLGSVLDLLPDMVRWADCICVATDPEVIPSVADVVRRARTDHRLLPMHAAGYDRFAQALVVPPMVCGVGACLGCVVQTTRAPELACTQGPVFDLLALL
jgi:dihydroorotate dehydrogenase electron transfer subunit